MKNRRFLFEGTTPLEVTKKLHNPAIGFYQIHTFYLQENIDFEELRWCVAKDDQLALIVCNIGYFKSQDLSSQALINLEGILSFFEAAQKDIILRIVYDSNGKGMENEPGLFSVIRTHLHQLLPVLAKHENSIYIYQGLLIGSWGEMHNSRFLQKEKLQEIEKELLEVISTDSFLALRKPSFYRLLHEEEESGLPIGFFDDGMFGSDTDLGTFGFLSRKESSWEQSWTPEEERTFLFSFCEKVPFGGEAVYSPAIEQEKNLIKAVERQIAQMQQLHVSYLNRVYDERIIDIWRKTILQRKDIWNQKSALEYIDGHLGYRFVIRSVQTKLKWKVLNLEIQIENCGFSNFYQDAGVEIWIEQKEQTLKYPVDTEIKKWKCNSRVTLNCQVPLEEGKISLHIIRAFDGREIRFANENAVLGTLIRR